MKKINFFYHKFVILYVFVIPLYCWSNTNSNQQSKNELIVSVNFSNISPEKSGTALPILKKTFFILSKNKHISLKTLEREYYDFSYPADNLREDIPIGLTESRLSSPKQSTQQKLFNYTFLGKYEEQSLLRVDLTSFDPQNKKILKSIKLEISGEAITLLPDSIFYSHLDRISRSSQTIMQPEIRKTQEEESGTVGYILPGEAKLKIYIKDDGIYKLSGKQIEKAGWDLSGVDPEYLTIILQGKKIPIHITGAEDGSFNREDNIEFWGESIWCDNTAENRKNIYTDYNIYWLIIADTPGLRLGNQAAVPDQITARQKLYPVSYPFTRHNEENRVFQRLPYAQNVSTEDHWVFSSSINGGEKKEFSFEVKKPYIYSTDFVNIICKLRGQCAQYGDHPVEFYLNNHYLGSTIWHDYDKISFSSNSINPVYLQENNNQLTVVNKSTSGLFAQLYLDWFKITYPREFNTDTDFLLFNPPRDAKDRIIHFEIKGFTDPHIHIYKKNTSIIYNPEIEAVMDTLGNTSYTVAFEDRIVDESGEYIAVTSKEISKPDSIVFVEKNNLRTAEVGADYVIISSVDSLGRENQNLLEFVTHKENQGLRAMIADLNDIYNEFNYGIPDPEALRKFLQYAVKHWHPFPRYTMLVGDGTMDPKASINKGNVIPVPVYQTVKYGAVPSDYSYSLLDDDTDPDIAIGRLPVQSKSELENIIQKIIDYENNSRGKWRNDYLMISAGTKEGDFGYQAEEIINNIMSPSINPKRMYLSGSINDPYLGGTEDLLRHFRNGTAWINFRGHGGGAIWSDGGLLDLDDLPLLENKGKLPFITSMTCFTGDYASRLRSLGESLLLNQETGAVAFFGSTGLGWVWNDYYLLKELFQCYTMNPQMSIGELINKAKTAYLLKYRSDLAFSEVYQFLLLGDPSLKLTIPAQKTTITLLSQAVRENNLVHIQGEAESTDLNISLSITDSSYAEKYSEIFTINELNWNFELPIPSDLLGTKCGIRAYQWNPNNKLQKRGFVSFSYGTSFFDSLSVVPKHPGFKDSLYFTAEVEDVKDIKNVFCMIDQPYKDTLSMYKVNELYRTRKVSPFAAGTSIYFHCKVTHEDGTETISKSKEISIPLLADLRIKSVFMSGRQGVELNAEISNYGQTDANNVIIYFSSLPQGFTGADTVSVSPSQTTISSVKFNPAMGINTVTVTIDPDSLLYESSRNNNIITKEIIADKFWITPEYGTTLDFTSTDTVGIQNKVEIYIPPDAINQPSCVSFEVLDDLPFTDYNSKNSMSEIYRIFFPGLGSEQYLKRDALFLFYQDTINTLKPYMWDTNFHYWVACEYQKVNKYITINSAAGGYYHFMNSDDSNPPYMEVQLNNQAFTQNSYVSRNPLFNVLLKDESPIDLRPSQIEVIIDEIKKPYTDLMIPDSTTELNDINLSFRHEFNPGNHSLQIKARDIHGNVNIGPIYSLQIGSELNIEYLGNHPNPFQVETVFVYVLTDVAKDVSLKIYTVSGKLIRNLSDNTMTSPDYHEIVWDGRDKWGNLVANGVYFFKLTAKGYDKTRKVTGKIAKIR